MIDFRRLISFGKSSFVVSLPKSWIEKNKLSKGDLVYLKENEHELNITSREKEESKEIKKAVITTDGKELDLLRAEIVSAYLKNFDLIEIKGADLKDKATDIKSILQNLAGVELLEQSSSRILTKDLLDLKEISVDSLIRRVDIIIRSMIDDSNSSPHEDFHESIYQRDNDVNRLVLLIKRVLRSATLDSYVAKSLNLKVIDLFRYWQVVNSLEMIADEVKRIARSFREVEVSKQNNKELEKTNKELREAYLKIMKAYHTRDVDLACFLEVEAKKRMDYLRSMLRKNSHNSVMRLVFHMRCFNGVMRDFARIMMN